MSRLPELLSWLRYSLVLWSWVCYFTYLCLSFFICKVGITVPTLQGLGNGGC